MGKLEKVVIVSLHKTGTTSVAKFLENLGYLVTGPDTNLYADMLKGEFKNIDSFLKKYDAFQDDPWYKIYPYIKKQFPTTKFIYLVRDEVSWLKSVQNFYGVSNYNNKVRRDFYGAANTLEHSDKYLKKYRSHQQEVYDFFENDDGFITIDVRQDDDAKRLQGFLGLPIKFNSFPHANKTPVTKVEADAARKRRILRSYFGLNNVVKKSLVRVVGYDRFISIRSAIRLQRAKFRVFKKRIFK